MHKLGHLLVHDRRIAVNLFEKPDLKATLLDTRVLRIADSTRSGEIVLCEIAVEEFLNEEETTERARVRKLIAKALDETDPKGTSLRLPLKFHALADSIEDVAIIDIRAIPQCLSTLSFSTPATVFVPRLLFGLLDMSGSQNRSVLSSPWKANTIDIFELENRFESELENWRGYELRDPSDGRAEVRSALASALGMQDISEFEERQRERYAYGYQIGEGVGTEHAHQWLAMDLKLEDFVRAKKVSHVDHSDDVFLFREPSIEECAKSVAPLYQQMDYPLWHAFRDGYWDVRRREALDVLLIFDGARVGEILGGRGIQNAVKARNAQQWDDALMWCSDAQLAFEAFRDSDEGAGNFYLAKLDLVRGDILFQRGSFEDALQKYDTAREELKRMVAQGAPFEFDIASALVNSAAVLSSVGRSGEARERLLQARTHVAQMSENDPRIEFITDAISRNLAGLKSIDQKDDKGKSAVNK